jgi:hypothetical protein
MTNAELNRDIKRLNKAIKSFPKSEDNGPYFEFIEKWVKPEFKRLYYADSGFTAMNRESILIMIRLNLSHRIIAFHQFGLNIEI